jgi:hypothetical protein
MGYRGSQCRSHNATDVETLPGSGPASTTEVVAMRILTAGLLALTIFSSAHAQRSAESLPIVDVDCYQSFATKTSFPESSDKNVSVANDDLATPLKRYRLQVAGKTILKIISDPDRDAFREEHGKSIWKMTRDFNDKHQIIAWREELPGGIVRLFSFDFADLVLSRLDISPAHSLAAGVELHVMKCNKSTVVAR